MYSCLNTHPTNQEVYILASWQGSNNQSVKIMRNGSEINKPVVLVLVSYDARQWHLELDSQVVITTVVLVSIVCSSRLSNGVLVRGENSSPYLIPCIYIYIYIYIYLHYSYALLINSYMPLFSNKNDITK